MNAKKIIIGVLAGVVIFYLVTSFIVDRRLQALSSKLEEGVSQQLEIVTDTATLLGRGAASESVAGIVPECSSLDTAKYDSLLSLLDRGLPASELIELKGLFDRCGDTASVRRSVMTLTLTEEVKALAMLASDYESLGNKLNGDSLIDDWNELLTLEQDISSVFNQLVIAQGNIIGALVSDTPASSLTVENIRVQAEEFKGRLIELTGAAAPLRSRLVKS